MIVPGALRANYDQSATDTDAVPYYEGEKLISLRLAVPGVLVAAAAAGCFTYFVDPTPPVEADQRLPPTAPDTTGPHTGTRIDQRPSAKEEAATAFQQAAVAILRPLPNAQTSPDEPPITGHIPLPKKRPIPRP